MTTPSTARLWLGFAILAIWVFGWAAIAAYLVATWHPWLAIAACAISWFGGIALARPIGRFAAGYRGPSDAPLPNVSTLNSPRNRMAVALANTALRLAHPSYRNVIKSALVLGFQEATRRATERARADSTPADEETTTA